MHTISRTIAATAASALLALGAQACRAQAPFSYPAHVVAKAEQQLELREQDWRDCFARGLAQIEPGPDVGWRNVGRVFFACEPQETRYVRAALTAAQRRFPEPRKDRYGRIVAWDQLSNFVRTARRAWWVQIRDQMEFSAMTALSLPPRCQRRYTNYATGGGLVCSVPHNEMGSWVFDSENPDP